ncbi:maleylpyruvate isomerase family mycothiol-dependent enzyme [Kitasatospora acidiphila]|uniref:Maleylpyruvate isomerase family mycothiol-dependent enzyme n=1 Tax=Kitasatospora acidiphila TaxID=2567942 RepID=A0A540WGK5_9ACTN|nr:maleylpyruvate isomerase family mycothiol-dependent enzyme [Kitasatospora acidiphila]TQF08088.1 maleylpyruvate isomerase family mycothiol-dependent enzyme [Kitasatospora acidiphila]
MTTAIDHRAAVAAETAAFVEAVRAADLTTPVPTCPGWVLSDLIQHAGSVQRWFATLLRQRIQERPRSREVDLKLPADSQALPGWLADSSAEAADAFATVDSDAPMWAWGADQHARFWARRMLFETLVHRADAELALGLSPAIDRGLAADGVAEFLVNLPFASSFAPGTAELRAADRSIRFSCSDGDGDGDGDWLVRLRPDGFGIDPDATEADLADATVQAPAADLLLLLYGRLDRTAAGIRTAGDEALLDLWFGHSAF